MIDITAGLKDVSVAGKSGVKFAISFKTDGVIFDADERALAQRYTDALVQVCRENLIAGKYPDGAPLGGIDPDTADRRQDLAEQGARSGEADPRYIDPGFRAKVKANYGRQYSARSGKLAAAGPFVPQTGGPRGNVSGLLGASFSGRPQRDGKGFVVYVAAARKQALPRVFGQRTLWSEAGDSQPAVQEAKREMANQLLGTRGQRLVAQAFRTAQKAAELRNVEASSAGDGGREGED